MKSFTISKAVLVTLATFCCGTNLLAEGLIRPVTALANITSCDESNVSGFAYLIERPSLEGVKQVRVNMLVRGLPPGAHAVHIHETGNCTPCDAAGGHFDPGPASLSNPDGNHPFHSGDLVNLYAGNLGYGYMRTITNRISLSEGPLSINDADGSAFIIHVGADSYCPDGVVVGCAGGARAACGIISINN
jgi:superoxide dismutase, Cu-Zn family